MLACTIVCINVARVAPDAMLLVYEDESLSCSFASIVLKPSKTKKQLDLI
jgi:hypothetical protein